MKITTKMLIEMNACEMQVRLFRRLFGNGGKVTLERCLLAAEKGMQLGWASSQFLTPKQEAHYDHKIEKCEALVSEKLPYWGLYDGCEPVEAEGVDRDKYNGVRAAIRRRFTARAFFAASQIGE